VQALGLIRTVVLNLGSMEPQGFGDSVLAATARDFEQKQKKIHDTRFIFPAMGG